jgi:LEA14-like dessication related protein
MVNKLRDALFLLALGLVLAACATRGPVVPEPPTVSVSRFNSYLISPQLVKFESQIVIRNRMPLDLDFERVDYAVDLFDVQLFSDTFSGLKRTRGNGTQTVTFPFQIAMEDILKMAPELLVEGSLRVTFRGEVYSAGTFGFPAIPFSETIQLPIPRIPEVAFQGVEILSLTLGRQVKVSLLVRNTNSFPISIEQVDSYLEINADPYRLLHSEQATDIPAGSVRTVVLEMETSPGKSLGMVFSLLQSPDRRLSVSGSVECGSPYGRIYVPLKLELENSP